MRCKSNNKARACADVRAAATRWNNLDESIRVTVDIAAGTRVMSPNERAALALVLALSVSSFDGRAAAHDGPHDGPTTASFKVTKSGVVTLGEDVKLGNIVVRKGRYQFAHDVDGELHLVRLTRMAAKSQADAIIYETTTRVIPTRQVRRASLLRAQEAADHADHSLYISLIEIQGETGDHIPVPRLGTY
jgi:hypothetical protein